MFSNSMARGRIVGRSVFCGAVAGMLVVAACGGGGSSNNSGGGTPTTPSPTPAPTGSTITITSSGVSPRSVTVAAGSRVTFVNNDTAPHTMNSDPHPEHSACPAINDVGFLQPGQSRATGNLNTPRTCGFHDHNRDSDTSLQGSIVIQ
jgi:plastocyanin